MQIAAHEARSGHRRLAEELREIVDDAKARRRIDSPVPNTRPKGDLATILRASYPKTLLADIILGKSLSVQILRLIREQRHASRILRYGPAPRRKLLLPGPSGTGKKLTASVLAGELGLPLFQVRLDGLKTNFMGKAAAKLRQVFDATSQTRGVYLFDEFDGIGWRRGLANDVGENCRVLNSILLMNEQDRSHSLVIAATNHPNLLDGALFRHFDDVPQYELPDQSQISKLLKNRLSGNARTHVRWNCLADIGTGLSFAEVARAANEVLKDALIRGCDRIGETEIRIMLEERKSIAEKLRTEEVFR